MPIDVSCPTCQTSFRLGDNQRGKRVRCRHCADAFTVPGEPAEESPLARSNGTDPLHTEPKPSRSPAGKSRSNDEDDEAPRRRSIKKPASGGSALPWVLGTIGGVIVLALVVCGGAFYWMVSSTQKAVNNIVVNNPAFNQPVNLPFDDPFAAPKDLNEALAFLQNGDGLRRRVAAEWLQKQPINAARQREVAQALEKALEVQDIVANDEVAKALKIWADQESVPGLIRALDIARPFGNEATIDTLARLKDPRGIEAIAKRLAVHTDRRAASKALRAVGPGAEKAVLPLLESNEVILKWEVCGILKDIGTKQSLPALEKAAAENRTRFQAQQAIAAIKARDK